jgi:hypothetical protein
MSGLCLSNSAFLSHVTSSENAFMVFLFRSPKVPLPESILFVLKPSGYLPASLFVTTRTLYPDHYERNRSLSVVLRAWRGFFRPITLVRYKMGKMYGAVRESRQAGMTRQTPACRPLSSSSSLRSPENRKIRPPALHTTHEAFPS